MTAVIARSLMETDHKDSVFILYTPVKCICLSAFREGSVLSRKPSWKEVGSNAVIDNHTLKVSFEPFLLRPMSALGASLLLEQGAAFERYGLTAAILRIAVY